MSKVHKDVILEALCALTGISLQHHTDVNETVPAKELNIFNLTHNAITGAGLAAVDSSNCITLRSIPDACQEMSVNLEDLLDPKYDYDFTHCNDKSTCMRGNEAYKRPCGWNRIALKVLVKYPDGNVWLGPIGWRCNSSDGEWPVSYHGTSMKGATGITESHYEPGSRQLYGRGIYSTPDIEVASSYSKQFRCNSDGKTYKVLMQNRINPQMRKVCDRTDYWLIEIPKGTSPEKEREIVEKSIRPYGILLKEVKK
ncbi:hypothetical protein IRJ41_011022 [Triplophysa rosa]|uniref:Uncharacterized protein n=1 Tax=Triplophysa rosa TaxID=992332 RepID=A0A9W8C4Z4_TRIRA|nr:hypothetical protein IRJ41_011022 [Triplophysa rosa]